MQGKRKGLNKKIALTILIIVLAGLGTFLILENSENPKYKDEVPVESNNSQSPNQENSTVDNSSTEDSLPYNVECPQKVMSHCESIAKQYNGDVNYGYRSSYTSMDGHKYFVNLVSEENVADTGAKNVTISFDGESGEIWDVRTSGQN